MLPHVHQLAANVVWCCQVAYVGFFRTFSWKSAIWNLNHNRKINTDELKGAKTFITFKGNCSGWMIIVCWFVATSEASVSHITQSHLILLLTERIKERLITTLKMLNKALLILHFEHDDSWPGGNSLCWFPALNFSTCTWSILTAFWCKSSGKTPQTIPTCLSEMIRLNHICLAKAA